ncbi:MAG: hypothetical protein Ta2D_11930 [Rickettsiales bacterium]|nr:MAG: hypothetical protein Ta2D_11930 [Rickettsiales bacterium]
MNQNKINIIASDGNWSYHRIIKCNYRKIVKIRKDDKDKRKWSRDDNGNLIRDIKEKYYDSNGNLIRDIKDIEYNNYSSNSNSSSNYNIEMQYKEYKEYGDKDKEYNKCNDKDTKEIEYNSSSNTEKHYLLDCNKHIVDKAETSLVECLNGSLRGRFARFNRKTKAYSKSFDNLCSSVYMWIHRNVLIKNRIKYSGYSGYCYNDGYCNGRWNGGDGNSGGDGCNGGNSVNGGCNSSGRWNDGNGVNGGCNSSGRWNDGNGVNGGCNSSGRWNDGNVKIARKYINYSYKNKRNMR